MLGRVAGTKRAMYISVYSSHHTASLISTWPMSSAISPFENVFCLWQGTGESKTSRQRRRKEAEYRAVMGEMEEGGRSQAG